MISSNPQLGHTRSQLWPTYYVQYKVSLAKLRAGTLVIIDDDDDDDDDDYYVD